ncbi:CBS domain-containing protein [Methanocaldococcus fervens]|uniref:Signal transduction protein with CBS domains n=1 Tax=Methanocaldococcus fervens (strain DSM 4213 / JCM 15782 / AG86) TaxID=573064 RepID=C7P8J3_METFA|nr:CBS domain-containing protein [Methanocaldococcus fervens]ACV24875.1 putative signal transduction protein with CBS domains [Methanocaldococcus fervens AG86]
MKVKEIMNRDFVKVSPNDIGGEVIQYLYRERKSYAPVVEDGKLAGWITALDLLAGCKHSKIEDLMLLIDEIKILKEDDEISDELIDEMIKNEDIAYPVVNDNDEVVGTLSVFDLLKYYKNR